jgi:hypothetical protein
MKEHEGKVTDEKVMALMEALAAPFESDEVKFKPAVVSGNRALALAYVDARVIQDRLDDVLGVAGWQDEYECLPDGSVVCRLRLRLGAEWITKMDVGGPSEQPDEGDRRKAAFSDALKRAAVKFGVGRYLYRLPQMWADYDPQKRQFVRKPTLPASALPTRKETVKPVPAEPIVQKEPVVQKVAEKKPTRKETSKSEGVAARSRTVIAAEKEPTPTPTPIPTPSANPTTDAGHKLPANGTELQKRLYAYDKQLAAQGVCQEGDLVKFIVAAGVKAGFEPDLATWTLPAIQMAVGETRAFEAKLRQPNKSKDAA